ncbi:hypothetical protein C7M84_001345 [Penaeus vannamei]|uniref:Uncharacterized protein n=1 Tax=Penaeus vannamei TaxID=6689 RepID=A0A423TTY8_PENVA|nr:hypothetical protein C7M84_001345 [Penaeus vannamei]
MPSNVPHLVLLTSQTPKRSLPSFSLTSLSPQTFLTSFPHLTLTPKRPYLSFSSPHRPPNVPHLVSPPSHPQRSLTSFLLTSQTPKLFTSFSSPHRPPNVPTFLLPLVPSRSPHSHAPNVSYLVSPHLTCPQTFLTSFFLTHRPQPFLTSHFSSPIVPCLVLPQPQFPKFLTFHAPTFLTRSPHPTDPTFLGLVLSHLTCPQKPCRSSPCRPHLTCPNSSSLVLLHPTDPNRPCLVPPPHIPLKRLCSPHLTDPQTFLTSFSSPHRPPNVPYLVLLTSQTPNTFSSLVLLTDPQPFLALFSSPHRPPNVLHLVLLTSQTPNRSHLVSPHLHRPQNVLHLVLLTPQTPKRSSPRSPHPTDPQTFFTSFSSPHRPPNVLHLALLTSQTPKRSCLVLLTTDPQRFFTSLSSPHRPPNGLHLVSSPTDAPNVLHLVLTHPKPPNVLHLVLLTSQTPKRSLPCSPHLTDPQTFFTSLSSPHRPPNVLHLVLLTSQTPKRSSPRSPHPTDPQPFLALFSSPHRPLKRSSPRSPHLTDPQPFLNSSSPHRPPTVPCLVLLTSQTPNRSSPRSPHLTDPHLPSLLTLHRSGSSSELSVQSRPPLQTCSILMHWPFVRHSILVEPLHAAHVVPVGRANEGKMRWISEARSPSLPIGTCKLAFSHTRADRGIPSYTSTKHRRIPSQTRTQTHSITDS